ncbi:hypothetical protein PT274_01675 [Leuconostocaceae bacterium ESL0958]|nr:hypothetical protein [Leuconostocaceae bacterium ESL0958]
MKRLLTDLTNLLLAILLVVSTVGAVSLLPPIVNGLTNSFVKVLNLFLLLLFVIFLLGAKKRAMVWQRLRVFYQRSLHRYRWVFLMLALLFLVLWQFFCLYALHGTAGWDWAAITQNAIRPDWPAYFSYSPNNLLLLKLENIYWHLLGSPGYENFIIWLDALNIVLIDVAALFIYFVANKILAIRGTVVVTLLVIFSFLVVPFFVIPYSDTLSFFVVALMLATMVPLRENLGNKKRYVYAMFFAMELIVGYFLKPSIMVLLIATILVAPLIVSQNSWRNLLKAGLCCLVVFVVGFLGLKNYLYYHNGVIKIEQHRSLPLTHFAAMGMTGDGGYNVNDDIESKNIVNPDERNRASIDLMKTRYQELGGLFGYQKFLFHKQVMNTADGTFGWGVEGTYLLVKVDDSHGLKKMVQNFYLNDAGIATALKFNFRLIQQIIWLLTLTLTLFSLFDNRKSVLLLKLTAIGFFLFLLLFEGGRTRYLIQALPVIFLLAGIGYQQLRRKVSWRRRDIIN